MGALAILRSVGVLLLLGGVGRPRRMEAAERTKASKSQGREWRPCKRRCPFVARRPGSQRIASGVDIVTFVYQIC